MVWHGMGAQLTLTAQETADTDINRLQTTSYAQDVVVVVFVMQDVVVVVLLLVVVVAAVVPRLRSMSLQHTAFETAAW